MIMNKQEVIDESLTSLTISLKTQLNTLNYTPLEISSQKILDKFTNINQSETRGLLKLGNDLNTIYSDLDKDLHGINDIEKGIDKLDALIKELETYVGFLEKKL